MELNVLSKNKNELVFVLDKIDYAVANTLRRLIISEVCTLAIEDVHMIKNSSALYDEMLAHRLGLVPLKTDLRSYTRKDKCKCKGKGCVHCELKLKLKVKGPCTVYASNLKSKDPKISPVYPNTPIVKLLKNQEVELEATAVLSNGKDHTKFSPGLLYYQGYPDIKIREGRNLNKAAEVCPVNILQVANGKLKVTDEKKCILCKACEEASNAIEVKGSKDKFIFHIEPWGQLSGKQMLAESINVMDEKLNEFNKIIKKVK